MRALLLTLLLGLTDSAMAGEGRGGGAVVIPPPGLVRPATPWLIIVDGSPHKLVDCLDLRGLQQGWRPSGVSFPIKGARWISRDGKERRVRLGVDLATSPALTAPAGSWTDLILELDGPVVMKTEDGGVLSLTLGELTVALDTPAEGGDRVVVQLGLPAGLVSAVSASGSVGDAHPLAGEIRQALTDGALGCQVE